MALAKKSLLTSLEKLGFRYLWDSEGSEGRKFTVFVRDRKPYLQVMVMDHPQGEGFQVFSSLSDSNTISDDVKGLKKLIKQSNEIGEAE